MMQTKVQLRDLIQFFRTNNNLFENLQNIMYETKHELIGIQFICQQLPAQIMDYKKNSKKKSFEELFSSEQQEYPAFEDPNPQIPDSQSKDKQQDTTCSRVVSQSLSSKLNQKQSTHGKQAIIKPFDVTYNMPFVNFREKQSEEISIFIQDALKDKMKCRCLLLTGTPGAGKTSLAKRCLKKVLGIKTVFMSANASNSQFIIQFSYQLIGTKLRLPQLISYLEKRKAYQKIFVLLDEFDTLFVNAPVQFLDIFRVFSQPIEGISLIGTSNSIEMMRLLSQKYNAPAPPYQNVVFSPYKIQQIKNIILERVQQLKKNSNYEIQFQELTLKYIASKIYNFKGGDVRFVLEQMRAIISKSLQINQLENKVIIIFESACSVLAKLNKSHEIAQIMQNLPFQQALALIALYTLFEDNQYLEVSQQQVVKAIKSIQSVLKIDKEIYYIKDILMYLEVYQFVGIRYKKKQLFVTLKTSADTIKNAFEDDPLFGRYFWK